MAVTFYFIDEFWNLQSRLVRWNSTYLMLKTAMIYKKCFSSLETMDLTLKKLKTSLCAIEMCDDYLYNDEHVLDFNGAGRGTFFPMKAGMGNPRLEYYGYECGDGRKMLNGDGDGNNIPIPNSTYCHP
ncbi:unnamed protein product [Prunus armeniaca]